MNAAILRGVIAAAAAFSWTSPAQASRWIATSDPWIWIDIDSVQVEEAVSYYATGHSRAKGEEPRGSDIDRNRAIKCTTGESWLRTLVNRDAYLEDTTGSVEPEYRWEKQEHNSYSKPFFDREMQIVCGH